MSDIAGAADAKVSVDRQSGLGRVWPFGWAVAIVICVGCAISVGAYLLATELEERDHQDKFGQASESVFDQIENRIDRTISVLRFIAGFYAGSREVERDEFRVFVAALGEQHAVQALEWIPRVPDAQRAVFEAAARADGFAGFAFTERRWQGNMVKAEKRAEYFPVFFVEPHVGNEAAFGFDLGSSPARLMALNQARDSGEMVATSRITLVQETGDQFGFLVFIPIYLNGAPTGSVAERRENFTGLGLGVFRIGDLADAAAAKFSNSPIPVDIEIFDLSAPVETSRLYPKSAASVGEDQGSSNFLGTRKLTVGGREWSVVTVPTAAFLAESRSAWWPYTVLLAGLLFTGLTAQYLRLVAGRTREIQSLVEERTAKLTRANDELEVINDELDSFAHSISHDLRAPLRSLNGFSQALVEDYGKKLDGEAKDFLGRIGRASQRMGRMIDDILTLSRATREEIQSRQVDLSDLAQEILDEMASNEPLRDVTTVVAPDIAVQGDPRLLRIVLTNLLGNAWKFTAGKKHGVTIEFGVMSQDQERIYFVRDNGAGFDMAYSDKLFGIFQRLHTATEFEGNGVGLATVARLVRRHGGRAWAEGEVNAGASVYFTLES